MVRVFLVFFLVLVVTNFPNPKSSSRLQNSIDIQPKTRSTFNRRPPARLSLSIDHLLLLASSQTPATILESLSAFSFYRQYLQKFERS
ncbi:hypothetical protein L6452_12747 [Arctium lappa]|uniref:Uncharacterized protein n=1 Tax=Arctium lappa TaxID=4217 RepID=A0ACB9CGD2_ARCLA|nr:hypothetical protein L6452_12747 [Arctium lappa]